MSCIRFSFHSLFVSRSFHMSVVNPTPQVLATLEETSRKKTKNPLSQPNLLCSLCKVFNFSRISSSCCFGKPSKGRSLISIAKNAVSAFFPSQCGFGTTQTRRASRMHLVISTSRPNAWIPSRVKEGRCLPQNCRSLCRIWYRSPNFSRTVSLILHTVLWSGHAALWHSLLCVTKSVSGCQYYATSKTSMPLTQ